MEPHFYCCLLQSVLLLLGPGHQRLWGKSMYKRENKYSHNFQAGKEKRSPRKTKNTEEIVSREMRKAALRRCSWSPSPSGMCMDPTLDRIPLTLYRIERSLPRSQTSNWAVHMHARQIWIKLWNQKLFLNRRRPDGIYTRPQLDWLPIKSKQISRIPQ